MIFLLCYYTRRNRNQNNPEKPPNAANFVHVRPAGFAQCS